MISRACCSRRARGPARARGHGRGHLGPGARWSPRAWRLRQGGYVTFRAPTEYAAACFGQYGVTTNGSGAIAALWRPFHLIGLELGVSIASAALRGEPTGAPTAYRAEVAATAKRDLAEVSCSTGGRRDGVGPPDAGGRRRRGCPAARARPRRPPRRPIAEGDRISCRDVDLDPADPVVKLRQELPSSKASAAVLRLRSGSGRPAQPSCAARPLSGPNRAGANSVLGAAATVSGAHSLGTSAYRLAIDDRPPPSTITSGSRRSRRPTPRRAGAGSARARCAAGSPARPDARPRPRRSRRH